MKKQFWRFLLLLIIFTATMQLVSAQVRPAMAVYAASTPDNQLSRLSAPTAAEPERFVDLQIYVQGNFPFWAVNLSCTVGTHVQLDLVEASSGSNRYLSFPAAWGALADGVGVDD